MIRAPTAGIRASGTTSVSPKRALKRSRDVAHQLHVLALVVSDGHLVRSVGEHVGRHQHRVEEQPGRHQFALVGRLLLELVHAVEVAEGGDVGEQPSQLGVLGDVGLAKEDRALRVQPGGQQQGGEVVQALAQRRRLVGHRQRVQVDDAEDALAALLPGHVLRDRPDVIAEVLAARRLDAGEDAHWLEGLADHRMLGCGDLVQRRTGVV